MKKLSTIFLMFCISFCAVLISGCTPYNIQNLAKELESSVNNFVASATSLDWPTEQSIDSLYTVSNSQIDTSIDVEEVSEWIDKLKIKIDIMLSKRDDLSYSTNQLIAGNVSLNEDGYLSIKVYMDIIKDNSNYITNYNGMLKNQINQANELMSENKNLDIVNAYIIKAVETLQLRCAKIDTTILSMNSIIEIIDANLIVKPKQNNHTIEKTNPQDESQPQIDEANTPEPKNDFDETDNQSEEQDQASQEQTTQPDQAIVIAEDNIVETNKTDSSKEAIETSSSDEKEISREIYKESVI
ncbi:MAG: hypothetical protein IJ542_03455 [Clostridia bacterium]|nr:hypothetical protein [Clostridia bacterium]